MNRFQREAEVLASLNHSNISIIHGLEEADGVRALVLELVEGPTLAERIEEGPIPVEESLQIALEIIHALEAAHEKGIIHRDLKPANVKLTAEGKVKVLDFGLAKAFEPELSEQELAHSPTLTMEATQAGMVLGTAESSNPVFWSPASFRSRASSCTSIWRPPNATPVPVRPKSGWRSWMRITSRSAASSWRKPIPSQRPADIG